MNWKRFGAFLCAASLAVLLPGPEPAKQADAPAEVTLSDPPLVALTFDDGPRSSTTGPLLDGLELREVPATFFLVGNRIPGNEDLVRRMAAEGHQIGIHTYDHVELRGLSRQDFDLQVGKTRALITRLAGDGSYWLRPPYGFLDRNAGSWCGGPVILWSVDPEDWKDDDVDRIVAAVVEHVSDGDIILLHDLFPSSGQAALSIVDTLLERGFCFVTVEQLMEARGVTPEAGARYRKIPPPA
ncbi:MAG: polysaccharide deacetylase family protein [Lawsonibacter sp.]|nr:polysaccharide deacetylase family protein [Lawsonibacter sp.]MCI9654748.1 polysaccharide deacetylase family protein [Lawsonibacter sp.]